MIDFQPIIAIINNRFPFRKLDISIQQPVDGFAPESFVQMEMKLKIHLYKNLM